MSAPASPRLDQALARARDDCDKALDVATEFHTGNRATAVAATAVELLSRYDHIALAFIGAEALVRHVEQTRTPGDTGAPIPYLPTEALIPGIPQ